MIKAGPNVPTSGRTDSQSDPVWAIARFEDVGVRKQIDGYFGRRWFRRIVHDPIPSYISDVVALDYPLPIIRGGETPLVTFAYQPPFERDIQFWGWQDYLEHKAVVGFVAALVKRTGIKGGRVYTRWVPAEVAQAWLVFDAVEQRACFYSV